MTRQTLAMPLPDPALTLGMLSQLQLTRPPVFGASTHEFQVNPSLSEDEVLAFERTHHILLPLDYRRFLTTIGNGGAGPFYGVFPLGYVDDGFKLREWNEADNLVGMPSEPFGLEAAWNDLSGRPEEELRDRDESEYWRQMNLFEARYWGTAIVNGAIPICHEGCALRIWLVVAGSQSGYLWEDLRSEYGGLKPIRLADGSGASFAAWYEEWLKDCLSK